MGYLYVAILLCGMFTIVGFFTEKKILFNPITMFCGLWSVVLFFSSQKKFTMNVASSERNALILYGLIAYVFGYYVNKVFLDRVHIKIGKFSRYQTDKKNNAVPRYKLLYTLCTICLAYTMYDLARVVLQAGTLNLGTIQGMLQSGEISNSNSSILNAIIILVISPIKFILPAITAVDFFYGKRDKKLLWMTVGLILINMLSTANRTSFLLFFLWLFFVATLYLYHNAEKKNAIVLKIRKYKREIVCVGLVAFIIMTSSRTSSSIYRQLYLYFSMPPSMFEIWANKVDTAGIYGYGIASLLGFVYPIFYILKNICGIPMPSIVSQMYDWTMLTDTTWVWPGKNILANAYVSSFWFFYIDARMIGIIVGMFVFGIVLSRSYSNVVARNCSARQITVYCCLLYAVLFSFVRFQFSLTKISIGLLFTMFFAYKMKKKE